MLFAAFSSRPLDGGTSRKPAFLWMDLCIKSFVLLVLVVGIPSPTGGKPTPR